MHNCMTWNLFSDMAKQFFNCWSTSVKLAWGLDRATKTYIVDNLLAGGLPSMRSSVLACFGNFYKGVERSTSLEVRTLATIAAHDVRSTTGTNLSSLIRETGCDPVKDQLKVRETLLEHRCPVPDADAWRIPCLVKYLDLKHRQEVLGSDTSRVEALIHSLVTS